jgi:bile acid:Na+ symporter, BASS family
MTAFSTLISPVMTPLAMKLLAGKIIPVEFLPLMVSILNMILVPVVVGVLINRYLPKVALATARVLPAICMASICLIIGITIALSRDDLFKIGITLFFAAACHNGLGFGLGYGLARLLGLNVIDSRTVAIEVGMQNCGMATGISFSVLKSAAAALPSAVFGPWSTISGSILASWWRRNLSRTDSGNDKAKAAPPTGGS